MASLLTGLLSGAAMQYLADEDASDKLKGNIIDAVSRKLYEIDIPNEEASIKKMQTVKSALVTQFGKNTADVFDNLGFTQSGNLDTSLSQIEDYLEKYGETGDSFRTKVENFVKEKPQDFSSAYGQTTTGRRGAALDDRREHVNKLFSNTPYIRDLLIAPGQEQKGVMGKLFGGRVTPSTQIAARGRLEEATRLPMGEMPEAPTPSEMFGLTEVSAGRTYLGSDVETQRQLLADARQLYKQQYFNEYSKRFEIPENYKKEYKDLPDDIKKRINENDYAFERYFRERYLPQYGYSYSGVTTGGTPIEVLQAKETINQLKSINPDDPAIQQIKEDLKQILGTTNLSEYGL